MVTRLVRAPRIDFANLRRELELPTQFPLAAQREADDAAASVGLKARTYVDRTDIPFVTIDPIGSRDLDQAMSLLRRPGGYRVFYAIADVTAFVPLGGELQAETWRRGETVYLPDGKVPLHPMSLSEGAASLLPDQTRPAVLWTIDIDDDGATSQVRVGRAMVRSRAQLDYATVQAQADAGTLADPIAALPDVGRLLIARALERGAINLPIPEQELERDDDHDDDDHDGGDNDGGDADGDGGGWRLVLRSGLPAEEWNAQISLLTGMAAASLMLDGGVGLLRTMPTPAESAVARLRTVAAALDLDWPATATPGQMLAAVDASTGRGAAFVDEAAELLRGAGYTAFDGEPPADPGHGAVAAVYAHVTAPLRRLADRYATEVCLAVADGGEVPEWVRAALPELPAVMERSGRRSSAAQRGAIDVAEAVILADRIGEEFDATVLDVDERRSPEDSRPPGGIVAIDEPPVRARCRGQLRLGERVRVRLTRADARAMGRARGVEFDVVDAPSEPEVAPVRA